MTEKSDNDWKNAHLWDFAAVRDVGWLSFGLLVALVAFTLRDVLTLFLLAFAVAYVIKPVVDVAWRSLRIPRVVASAALVFVGIGGVLGSIVYFGPLMLRQSEQFAASLPERLPDLLHTLGLPAGEMTTKARGAVEWARENPGAVGERLMSALASGLGYLGRFISHGTYLATAVFVVPIYVFYFAWRYDQLLDRAKSFVPAGHRDRVLELFGRFDETFGRFVRGRIAIGLAQVVLFCVAFWAADVPFWFLLGVATGLLCIVPIVGFVGWPLAILARSLEGGTWIEVLVWPTVAYGTVQAIEVWVLTPYVLGRTLDVSPFVVLFAIMIGGSVGGLFGVLLAVPLANCLAIVYAAEIKPRLDHWSQDSAGAV